MRTDNRALKIEIQCLRDQLGREQARRRALQWEKLKMRIERDEARMYARAMRAKLVFHGILQYRFYEFYWEPPHSVDLIAGQVPSPAEWHYMAPHRSMNKSEKEVRT